MTPLPLRGNNKPHQVMSIIYQKPKLGFSMGLALRANEPLFRLFQCELLCAGIMAAPARVNPAELRNTSAYHLSSRDVTQHVRTHRRLSCR